MAITLGEALVYLTAKTDGFDQGLDKAETKTRGWAGNIGGVVSSAVGGAVVVGATAAVGAIAGITAAGWDMSNQVTEATGRIRTQLGLTEEQAEEFGKTITDVYANNFGDSIDDVANSLATVEQAMDALYRPTADELGSLTEYALALRDAFEVDVSESARAANQVMQQFGVSGEEAFEIIAAGIQKGLNSSDDFLDTLNEYSADFADLGFTADEALSFINSGIGAGIYNTDKLADAMREFKINLLDAGRLESIEGISPALDEAALAFQNGEITGVEAFAAIRKALMDIDDPLTQQEAGVALFGSLWEDLGKDAIFSLDTMSDSLLDNYDVLGSLNEQYDNLGDMWEGLKRKALTALAPLGDALLGIVNDNMPLIEEGFAWFEKQLPKIIDVGVKAIAQIGAWIKDPVLPLVEQFIKWWKEEALPAIKPVVQEIIAQLIPGLKQLGQWLGQLYKVEFKALGDIIMWVVDNFDMIGPIIAVVIGVLIALTGPIGAIVIALTALATAWANDWGGIQEKTAAFVEWFKSDILPAIEDGIAFIQDVVAALVEFFNEHILPRIENFFAIFNEIFQAFKSAFEGDWRGFGEHLRAAFDEAGELILGIMQSLGDIMLELMTNAVNSIISFVTETDWLGLGKSILDGIIEGITGAIPNLIESGEEAFSNAKEAWKGFWDIESPSGVTKEEIGIPMGEGVTEGFSLALEDLPEEMAYSANSLGNTIHWLGFDPAADAMQATMDAMSAVQSANFKKQQGAVDDYIAQDNANKLADVLAGSDKLAAAYGAADALPEVNLTIYADSQTNGEEVGKLAGQAYLDYINSRGGQT